MNTVERVLLNKNNGNLGIGIRVSFYDKAPDFPLAKLDGYSLRLASEDYEGWIIEDALQDGTRIWYYVNKSFVEEKTEILGEL